MCIFGPHQGITPIIPGTAASRFYANHLDQQPKIQKLPPEVTLERVNPNPAGPPCASPSSSHSSRSSTEGSALSGTSCPVNDIEGSLGIRSRNRKAENIPWWVKVSACIQCHTWNNSDQISDIFSLGWKSRGVQPILWAILLQRRRKEELGRTEEKSEKQSKHSSWCDQSDQKWASSAI